MPSATSQVGIGNGITKFTNCRLVKSNELVEQDLWVSSVTGKILHGQEVFYGQNAVPDKVIDLGGRIVSPGLIDVQLNGAFGFNFSTVPEDLSSYAKSLRQVNRALIETGVTSYLPTVTSQRCEVYHKVLSFLGPSGTQRRSEDCSESLGAHCEGPFLNPARNGIHVVSVLTSATSFSDLEDCYGASNLSPLSPTIPTPIKLITAAPEIGSMTSLIPALTERNIAFSIGHSDATYEEASAAVASGARMITHLFNAMRPLHHRNPGIFGVLGIAEALPRPFFGIIADGIHLHPASVKIAYSAHPDGCILVTDAMHLVGLPDGLYDWAEGGEGSRIIKCGDRLTLEGSEKIAGSAVSLVGCVNNFLRWSGAGIPAALRTVTSTPARMLGLQGIKGTLDEDADADLVVFGGGDGGNDLVVEQVWKFGMKMFDRAEM